MCMCSRKTMKSTLTTMSLIMTCPVREISWGVGVTMTLSQKIKVYADVEYSKGDGIEQPLGGSVGAL